MPVYQTIATYLLGVAILVVILWAAIPEETDDENTVYYHCPTCGLMRGFDEPWFESTGCYRCPRCRSDLRRGRQLL